MIQKSFQKTINNLEIIKIFFQFSSRIFLFVRYYFLCLITTFGYYIWLHFMSGWFGPDFGFLLGQYLEINGVVIFVFIFLLLCVFSTRADNEIMPTCKNDKDQTRSQTYPNQDRLPLHALNKSIRFSVSVQLMMDPAIGKLQLFRA